MQNEQDGSHRRAFLPGASRRFLHQLIAPRQIFKGTDQCITVSALIAHGDRFKA
jgi:hypothetical protein